METTEKLPKFLQFIIHSEDGGYWAEAVGYSIYTQGDTLDEMVHNIREATGCHFFDGKMKKSCAVCRL